MKIEYFHASKFGRELARYQRVRPIIDEILQAKGLVKFAEDRALVTGLTGPLEEGRVDKVATFAAKVPIFEERR